MRKSLPLTVALAALLVPALDAAPALALIAKSYVASGGSDGNTCATPADACATFQGAHDKTAPGGEVSVVNTGSYDTFRITKAIHFTNDGAGEAAIFAPAAVAAIFVNAGVGSIVSLRGVVIDGDGNGGNGIQISSVSAMHIQNCVIRNFEASGGPAGIFVQNSTGNIQLFVSDSLIYNNGSGAASAGIHIKANNGFTVNAVLDRLHIENNVRGLWVEGGGSGSPSRVILRDSVVSGNAADGILASTTPGAGPAFIAIQNTASVNNAGTGIRADGPGATMLLDNTFVIRNAVGLATANGGQLISYGNNKVNNNIGADGTPTGSYSPL